MPKNNMTEAERKAWGAEMRAKREAKAAALEKAQAPGANALPLQTPEGEFEQPAPNAPAVVGQAEETIQNEELSSLTKRIAELETMLVRQANQQQVVNGSLVGWQDKYNLNPNVYPDETLRLAKEPKLSRYAFEINYDLNFTVSTAEYKALDGVNTREPRFTLQLAQVMIDEETGDPTNGRIVRCRLIFHEDPDAALVIARDNGIEVEQTTEVAFLNEMRYLRMRDWLLECFYPPPVQQVENKREVVIAGKLVEYYEVNSEGTSPIKFGDLDQKKKF